MRRVLIILVAVLAVVGSIPVPVVAVEDPRFEVYVPEPELQPGVQQTLTVQLVNDAEDADDQVDTATNVRVTARSGGTPIEVVSGPRLVGTMQDGSPQSVAFQIAVPGDARGGTYRLPLEVTYEFEGDERDQTTVYAEVRIPERPIFTISSVESDLFLEETGVVTLTMENVGLQAANETTLSITSTNPALTLGGTQTTTKFAGDWAPGQPKAISFAVTATQAAIAKEYAFQIQPTYQDENDITTQAPPRSIGVAPENGNRFAIVDASSEVALGETGSLELTLENRGETTITDASVRLESVTPAISFEGQSVSTQFIGAWGPGETRTITADVTATKAAESRQQSVQASVSFKHQEGARSLSGPYDVGIAVSPEQEFGYSDIAVDLRGSSAVLTAQVTNRGDRTVEDAVVTLSSMGRTVQVLEPTDPVGTLEPGQSAQVSFDLRVSADANPGPRQFNAQVEYDRGGTRSYQSDPVAIRADFPTDEDLFTLEPVNATFGIDTTNQFRVRITNDGDATLTDIQARLQAQPPYESQTPSAFVDELGPGESAVLTFEVTTPEDAVPSSDAIGVNVSAKTETEQTVVAGPYLVPVTIAEETGATSDTTALAVGAVVVVILLGAGWWWLNR